MHFQAEKMRYKLTNIRRIFTSGEYQVAEMNEIGV